MVGGFDDVQSRLLAQLCADGAQQLEIGECVARSLQEEHRDGDFCEVVGASSSGPVGRVKWKPEED